MTEPVVISLGGSVLVPRELDAVFLRRFVGSISKIARTRRVYIICGGGGIARSVIERARAAGVTDAESLHWIGVRACQLNAAVLGAAFGRTGKLLLDRSRIAQASGRVIVVAASKPGTTTDYGSVLIARAVRAKTVYNITNVDGVYTADPRKVRTAKFIPALSWAEFRRMFGQRVTPGMHVPFDPEASALAQKLGFRVAVISSDLRNLSQAITGKRFRGTVLG